LALHINIFGAPGSGKSTMRSRLFYELKKNGYKVEEVVEYAKELVYGEDNVKLNDQTLVLSRQHHPHQVLDKKVDYIVTDSPFIMGMLYLKEECDFNSEIKNLAKAMHNSYNTLNIFLTRDHEYQTFGRYQTEKESDRKGEEIKTFMIDNNIDFIELKSGKKFIKKVLSIIKGK